MGKVKGLLIDNEIDIMRYYISKIKNSSCTSTKCCIDSAKNKGKTRNKRCH